MAPGVTAPATAGAGSAISVSDTTRNQGGASAPASVTNLYLSTDGAVSASDVLLGSRAVPALSGATNSSGSTTVTIPAGTASGGYYILAQADGELAVPETVETNNTAWAKFTLSTDSSGNRKVTVTDHSPCESPGMCGELSPNR